MFPNKSLGRSFKQATVVFLSNLNPNARRQTISQYIASKAEKVQKYLLQRGQIKITWLNFTIIYRRKKS